MARRPKLPMAVLVAVVAIQLVGYATSAEDDQFAKAKQECVPQLAGLAPCLSYVGGNAKTPTMDCCTAMKQVLAASKKCVCLLVKYKDDPSLGIKFDVNRALALPGLCHSAAKLSECPTLLHLSPNSAEAKMFENYDKSSSNSTIASSTPATATTTASPATASNDTKAKNGGFGSHESLRTTAVLYGVVVAGFFFLVCSF